MPRPYPRARGSIASLVFRHLYAADGGDWDIFPTAARQTFGRAWPLLTGERGEYELLAGRRTDAQLRTMAGTANDGLMPPEQVWDGRPPEP